MLGVIGPNIMLGLNNKIILPLDWPKYQVNMFWINNFRIE